MSISDLHKKINKICSENPEWLEDDILLIEPKNKCSIIEEDPIELARYGFGGHIDESLMGDGDYGEEEKH